MTFFNNLWLTTLDNVRLVRGYADSTEDSDDNLIQALIPEVSTQFIAEGLGRIPLPYIDTKQFAPARVRGRELLLQDDLLAATSVTNGNGGSVSSSNYNLRPDNSNPKQRVELTTVSGEFWNFTFAENRVQIVGTWGYLPHYAQNAFTDSGVNVPTATLPQAATSLVLDGGEGASFEVGQYIRIESEIIQITAISTDTLTLARAELGTTDALHASGVDIEHFNQLADIQLAVNLAVDYLVKNKDQIGSRITVFDGGVVQIQDLDPRVQKIIQRHRHKQMPLAV